MALQTYPPTAGTVSVSHSGDAAGDSFTALLSTADDAPIAPSEDYTWTLATAAPDLVGVYPHVSVYEASSGVEVFPQVLVTASEVTVIFFEAVEPTDYRVKVTG